MRRRRSGQALASVLLALAGGLAAGCMTVGRNFASASVPGIERGVSTKQDIQNQFGEPFRKGLDDGYESWSYVYNQWSMLSQTRSKDLYVVFNKDGTVRSYTFNSNLD